MALDGIVISNITAQLAEKLTGSRISKIAQPEADELLLTLKGINGQYRLLLSAGASLPLIYLTKTNKPSPLTAPNFCMLLRKHIGNGKITRIYQPGLERIIHFEIEHFNEMGDICHKDLVIELMGKHSNIIFCDEKGMIIDSIKHVSAQTSSVREVLPGRPYFIAVTQDKLDPLDTNENEFCSAVFSKPMPLAKAIYTTYTGISPLIAEEVCHRASLESAQSANSMEGLVQIHLYRQFELLMEEVKACHFSPAIIYDEKHVPVEFTSVPLTLYRDLTCVPFDSPSEMLEQYYAMKNTVTRIRQKSSDLRRITTTALDRCRKKHELQKRQLLYCVLSYILSYPLSYNYVLLTTLSLHGLLRTDVCSLDKHFPFPHISQYNPHMLPSHLSAGHTRSRLQIRHHEHGRHRARSFLGKVELTLR